jgi:hypothetical protein
MWYRCKQVKQLLLEWSEHAPLRTSAGIRRRNVLGLSLAAVSLSSAAAAMPSVKTATDKHKINFIVWKQRAVTIWTQDTGDSWQRKTYIFGMEEVKFLKSELSYFVWHYIVLFSFALNVDNGGRINCTHIWATPVFILQGTDVSQRNPVRN